MSIRYECEHCGSVLKIKDDLAGKPGKCPKCKTAFTVPALSVESESSSEIATAPAEGSDDAEPMLAVGKSSAADFDLDAFLLGDDQAGSSPAKAKTPKSVHPLKTLDDDWEKASASTARKKSSRSDLSDEDTFEIRRGPDAPDKPKPSIAGLDEELDETPRASRRPPGTNPNAPASNIASDLLSKSAKKGKKASWDDVEPEKKAEVEFDWEALRYEVRTKLVPVVVGAVVLFLMWRFLLVPMFGNPRYEPKLGQVTGKVTLNGQPLAGVQVWFYPDHSTEEWKGKKYPVTSSLGLTDAMGRYELIYDAERKGAILGKCRVQIEASNYTGIAERWFLPGKTSVYYEVKAGKQVIDLELSQ